MQCVPFACSLMSRHPPGVSAQPVYEMLPSQRNLPQASPRGVRAISPATLFDAGAGRPLRCQGAFLEDETDFSPAASPPDQIQPGKLRPLPRLWVGYLRGFASLVAEFVAACRHPDLAKAQLPIPPLYLFLAVF